MNSIMILGVLIAVIVFVFDWFIWVLLYPFPDRFIIGTVTGILLATPIIVGFGILSKRKSK